MTIRSPFKPHYGTTQTFNPASSSATITIGRGDKSLRLINTGANICFFRTGPAASIAAATAADCPVAAGQTLIIEKAQDDDTLAHISATGTTLVVTSGEGGA